MERRLAFANLDCLADPSVASNRMRQAEACAARSAEELCRRVVGMMMRLEVASALRGNHTASGRDCQTERCQCETGPSQSPVQSPCPNTRRGNQKGESVVSMRMRQAEARPSLGMRGSLEFPPVLLLLPCHVQSGKHHQICMPVRSASSCTSQFLHLGGASSPQKHSVCEKRPAASMVRVPPIHLQLEVAAVDAMVASA